MNEPVITWSECVKDGVAYMKLRVEWLYVHPTLGPKTAVAEQLIAPSVPQSVHDKIEDSAVYALERYIYRQRRQADLRVVPEEPPQYEFDWDLEEEAA